MMKRLSPPTEREVATLKARLEEAEQTLDAIRAGKVDALIVSGPEGERVFTLQGADHRYRRIVEGMTEGAVIVSPQGVVLYANSAFAELVAAPLDRVLGSPFRQYVPASASVTFARLLSDAKRAVVTAESSLLAAGRVVPIHVSAASDGEGLEGGICLIVTNLTRAMREAEQRFQFVADMLPQIIWSARPDGWTDYYNRRWFDFTGLTLQQSEGTGWTAAVHAEDVARYVEAWSQSVAKGEAFEMAYRLRRGSDGAYRWHLGRAIPQRDADHGAILRWYGTSTDIEDERALGAEAERARDKAEEATRLKDEFLATLSHELRTPLNAILGWARMLESNAVPSAQRPRAVEAIVRNAVAQNQLIEDLLDVSRIVAGKLRLSVAPVHLHEVIEAALDVVRPGADAKGVRVHPVLDVGASLVAGDAARLQQVVWNLLANAVKFTPRGGRVQIVLRRVESSAEIVVSDSGVGIAPGFLRYVFDRFRQEDGAITRRTGGLGLGLAIVKNIVELHGGTVEALSDGEHLGATFIVRLPLAPLRASRPSSPPTAGSQPPESGSEGPKPAELSGLKVLVVDDEVDARDLLTFVLEQCDATVTSAGSAAEALALVPDVRPDVIVSDVGMPGEDGYSFIRKLRAMPREAGGRTPAIALTAYARTEDRTRALMAGFQSHATKPIDPREFLLVVANLSGRFS